MGLVIAVYFFSENGRTATAPSAGGKSIAMD